MIPSEVQQTPEGDVPLVVDLDTSLLQTDLMVESLVLLAKKQPMSLLEAVSWLSGGMARFKQKLAQEAMPDIKTLPFNPTFLGFLEEQKASGRRLVLVTAADRQLAEAVAAHCGLFDQVISSDGENHVRGEKKRDGLVAAFGVRGFDYAGSCKRDGVVFAAARRAVLVGTAPAEAERLAGTVELERVIERERAAPVTYWNAMRPRQWIKNALVFLPLLAETGGVEASQLLEGCLAAAAFSLCASSGYIFNDLMDLPNDRHHPAKKRRPIASGEVSLIAMLALVPLLVVAGVSLGIWLPPWFAGLLMIYYGLTLAYSLRLKDIVILDVLALASLYSLRVLAGAIACGVAASVWLLAFCSFLFLSLGLVKRYAELVMMRSIDGANAHARAYVLQDRAILAVFGIASGYIAVLLLVLFQSGIGPAPGIGGMDLAGWGLCALFVYWISYVWLVAHRGHMVDDPLTFALHDRTSRILIVLVVAAFTSRWL